VIVVDSSVWIANLRREPLRAVARLWQPDVIDQVLVGDIVLAEVLQGARDDRHAAVLEAGLRQFPVVAMLGADLAVAAARHYRQLRASGFTMNKIADLIIGTFCIAHGHTLLHCDADFVPMQICGLRFP
jgi:predicted nucleic acid-binding protein